ncbi:hypothetical protein ACLKA6_006014 [Drosophila palustris]
MYRRTVRAKVSMADESRATVHWCLVATVQLGDTGPGDLSAKAKASRRQPSGEPPQETLPGPASQKLVNQDPKVGTPRRMPEFKMCHSEIDILDEKNEPSPDRTIPANEENTLFRVLG